MTDITTMIKLIVDQSSASNTKRAIASVEKDLADLAPVTRASVRSVQRDFDSMQGAIQENIRFVDDLRQELERLNNTDATPDINVQSNRRGRGSDGFTEQFGDTGSFFSAIGGLEAIGGAGGLLGELGQVGDIVEALGRIGPAGAAAGVAVGAFALALSELSKQADKSAQSARNLINTQEEYFSAVLGGTSETLEAQITAQQFQVNVAQASYDELNRVIETGYQETARGLGVFTDVFLEVTNFGGARELREQRTALDKELQQEVFLLGRLIAERDGETIATNDAIAAAEAAAEAERELTAIRNQAAVDRVQTEVRVQQEVDRLLREGTSEGVNDTINSALEEIRALLNANADLALQNTEQAQAQVGLNNARIDELMLLVDGASAIEGLVTAREREAEAAKTLLSGIRGAISDAADGINQAVDVAADLKSEFEDVAKAQKAIDDLNAENARNVERIRRDLADREAEIIRSGADRAAEISEQYGIDRRYAEEDLADDLLDIQRRFTRENLNAIGDRDALASFLAKQQADQETDDAERAADKEARRRNEAYQRQLRDLSASIENQLRTARAGAQRQLQLEQERYNRELQLKQQALQVEQQQLTQYLNGIINEGARGYSIAYNQFAAFVAGLASAIPVPSVTVPSVPTITPPDGPPGAETPTFSTAASAPGGIGSVSFTIVGSTREQIFRELEEYMDDLMIA